LSVKEVNGDLALLHHELGIPPDYAASCGLPLQPEALERDLVVAGVAEDGREIRLTRPTVAAWRNMRDAAAADGVVLTLISGFRSVARQTEIIRRKLAYGLSIGEILHSNAAPGHSEHHTGRAIDVGTPGDPPLEATFAITPAYEWLGRRAHEFGFRLSFPPGNSNGIAFEPWH